LPDIKSPTSAGVTVSIGVSAMYLSQKLKKEAILEKTDMLFYQAKENGGNRIEYQAGAILKN